MKKIIILVFLLILAFTFSMVVSAEGLENLFDLNKISKSPLTKNGLTFNYIGDGTYSIDGTCTDTLPYIILDPNKIYLEPGYYILYSGPVDVQLVLESKDSDNIESFSSKNKLIFFYVEELSTINAYFYCHKNTSYDNVIVYPSLVKYSVAPNGVRYNYTESDIQDSYTEGVSAGTFIGYENGFSDGLLEGEAAGYKDGKAEGYELGANNGELIGYIDGYKIGYTNYKNSTDYVNALKSEYSSGFKEGAASIEQEQHDNTLAILLPMIIIDLIIFAGLIVFKSRKRRKNK